MKHCIVCGEVGRIVKEMCPTHYNRMRRYGRVDVVHRRGPKGPDDGKCSVVDCGKPRQGSTQVCEEHQPMLVEGAEEHRGAPSTNGPLCSIVGCGRGGKLVRGWCGVHYSRWKRHRDPEYVKIGPDRKRGSCSAEGCDRPEERTADYATPLCTKHYARLRRLGSVSDSVLQPLRPPRYTTSGYLTVWDQATKRNRGVHALTMEAMLGRPLTKNESVHHKNGVRDDNRPENLELWSTAQPAGQRVEDKLRWAYSLLETYGDEVEVNGLATPQHQTSIALVAGRSTAVTHHAVEPSRPYRRSKKPASTCMAPECVSGVDREVTGTDLCALHADQIENHTVPFLPLEAHQRRLFFNASGYVYFYPPRSGSGKAVHRAIMEEALGRTLTRKETVHHKNGMRYDNDPSNLELWSTSHAAGQRVEEKLRWAVDFIKTYETHVAA